MPKITIPTLYSQMDSRWGSVMLGYNTALPYNIYNFGCLITCLAMACKYYGKDENPQTLNEKLKAGNIAGFTNGGLYVWDSLTKIYGDIKETRTATPSKMTDGQIGEIRSAIDKGYPVMIWIDVNPKTVASDMHWVLVTGYNPQEENDLIIADPLGGRERSLKDYLGWYKPSIRNTIETYVILTGTKPAITNEMIPISKDSFTLYTRNHDQWHKMCNYLKPDADPNGTLFEDLQTIIAGIKSRSTDLENQAKKVIGDNAVLTQEIENRKQQVSRLETQVLETDKKRLADLEALKASIPDVTKIRGEYEGRIKELQGSLNTEAKAKGEALLELAQCKAGQNDIKETNTLIQKLLNILQKIFKQ
jgi:hypothetical protein